MHGWQRRMRRPRPVSYTHLDVYKRQEFGGTYRIAGTAQRLGVGCKKRIRLMDRRTGILIRELWSANDGAFSFDYLANRPESVSYTHLDVYKRQVPALLKGQLVLVHHTTGQSIGTTLSSDQVFNCGRTRLYRATIAGANGVRLSPEYYTVNRELGTVTMKPSAIVTTGLTTPFWLEHTIADLCVISDNDLSGWLTMTRPLSHTFPITESKVSGVLYIGLSLIHI